MLNETLYAVVSSYLFVKNEEFLFSSMLLYFSCSKQHKLGVIVWQQKR